MIRQRTIRSSIKASGIGLHTGKKVNIEVRPAPPSSGIVFRRVDVKPHIEINAHALNVHRTLLSTEISKENVSVCTIEHLISAFAGMGIDNAIVDIDGDEVPIMDGSSSNYIFLLQSCGIKEQNELKKYLRILNPLKYKDDDRVGEFLPYNGYRITMEINFEHPVFEKDRHRASLEFSNTSFIKELSRSRTFGFTRDLQRLQEERRALGGNFNNAVVLDDEKVINQEGLRHPQELLHHKMLDAIGDLHLIGYNIIGEFRGYKSGHMVNNKLIRKLLDHPESFRIEEFKSNDDLPSGYRTSEIN